MIQTFHRISNSLLLPASLSLVTLVACHGTRSAPPMADGVRFVPRAAWGARAPVLPMTQHVANRLTIHHTATVQNRGRTAEDKLRRLQAFSQREDSLASGRRKPAWADVAYHYYIAVDGAVAEGREWRYVGDTNTEYNPTGHLLVVVEENFETDSLTSAQRTTLDRVVPALARHFSHPAVDSGGTSGLCEHTVPRA